MFGAGPRLKAASYNGPTGSMSLVGWVDPCPRRVPGLIVHRQDAEALETHASRLGRFRPLLLHPLFHAYCRLCSQAVMGAGLIKGIEVDVVPAPKELTTSVLSGGSV